MTSKSSSAIQHKDGATIPPRTAETPNHGISEAKVSEHLYGEVTKLTNSLKNAAKYKRELVWRNILAFGYLHLAAIYGVWLMFTSAKWATIGFALVVYLMSMLGIFAGAHRLWSHRSYKAKWPLRLILIIFNTIAFQDSVYHWARDHRMHHKFSETNADPYNASRGLFFSHLGWLLCKKHPDVKAKGKLIDLSDLEADPFVMFQKKHYMILMPITCFILPTIIPMFFWNESFLNSWFVATMFRWCMLLNVTWCVNSAAHAFGHRAYDGSINPADSLRLDFVTLGEGNHNFHHVFPWDYKTAEWGNFYINIATGFINFFEKIGWAYDLKTVSQEAIGRRVKKTGDGSHRTWGLGHDGITKSKREGISFKREKKE